MISINPCVLLISVVAQNCLFIFALLINCAEKQTNCFLYSDILRVYFFCRYLKCGKTINNLWFCGWKHSKRIDLLLYIEIQLYTDMKDLAPIIQITFLDFAWLYIFTISLLCFWVFAMQIGQFVINILNGVKNFYWADVSSLSVSWYLCYGPAQWGFRRQNPNL